MIKTFIAAVAALFLVLPVSAQQITIISKDLVVQHDRDNRYQRDEYRRDGRHRGHGYGHQRNRAHGHGHHWHRHEGGNRPHYHGRHGRVIYSHRHGY